MESNKYMVNFIYKKFRRDHHKLQFEDCYILLHSKLSINFYTPWNLNWLEKYMPNCTLFLFCSIIITQLSSARLKNEL